MKTLYKRCLVAIIVVVGLVVLISHIKTELFEQRFYEARKKYENMVKDIDSLRDQGGYIESIYVRPDFDDEIKYQYSTLDDEVGVTVNLSDDFSRLKAKDKYITISKIDEAVRALIKQKKTDSGYAVFFENKQSYNQSIQIKGVSLTMRDIINTEYKSPGYDYDYSRISFEINDGVTKDKYDVTRNYTTGEITKFEKRFVPSKYTNTVNGPTSYPYDSYTLDKHNRTIRSSSTTSKSSTEYRDIDDLDVEGLYEDFPDEFEDIDDAYDYLEDNPDEWDDY